ncbi:hypothetical protein HK405_002620, partial [Cladochytrium tenue]
VDEPEDAVMAASPANAVTPDEEDPDKLAKAATFAYGSSIVLTVVLIIIWPIPMFAANYVFSKGFFIGWVVFGLIWSLIAAATVIFLPIWESRDSVVHFAKGVARDVAGTRGSAAKKDLEPAATMEVGAAEEK